MSVDHAHSTLGRAGRSTHTVQAVCSLYRGGDGIFSLFVEDPGRDRALSPCMKAFPVSCILKNTVQHEVDVGNFHYGTRSLPSCGTYVQPGRAVHGTCRHTQVSMLTTPRLYSLPHGRALGLSTSSYSSSWSAAMKTCKCSMFDTAKSYPHRRTARYVADTTGSKRLYGH